MKGLVRFTIAVLLAFLVAPALARAQGVFHPVCPTTGDGSRIVATKMIDTTDDPSTGQRTFRMLYEIRPITGPTSQVRICVGKEPTAVEPIPPKLPPQETLAPPVVPPPAEQVTNPPVSTPPSTPPAPSHPGRSCWKRVSWCTVPTGLGLVGLGAWALCGLTDVCSSADVRQEVHQTSVLSGNAIPQKRGVRLTLLSLPLHP